MEPGPSLSGCSRVEQPSAGNASNNLRRDSEAGCSEAVYSPTAVARMQVLSSGQNQSPVAGDYVAPSAFASYLQREACQRDVATASPRASDCQAAGRHPSVRTHRSARKHSLGEANACRPNYIDRGRGPGQVSPQGERPMRDHSS
eukprot:scaffold184086_cov29-Prasinocladus_malaysianus.AAC.1